MKKAIKITILCIFGSIITYLTLVFLHLVITLGLMDNDYDSDYEFLNETYELHLPDNLEIIYEYDDGPTFTGARDIFIVINLTSKDVLDNFEFKFQNSNDFDYRFGFLLNNDDFDITYLPEKNKDYYTYSKEALMLIYKDNILIIHRQGH